MQPVKRIEILTGVQELSLVQQALERNGITGYMVLHDVRGKGDRHLESFNPLTGGAESRLIKTTCSPERLDGLVESLRPILTHYGGACVVYDAQCLVLGRPPAPQAGAGV